MARKIRLTPFARLLIVLIIAAPIAYLAASYYNGQDGIQNLKELIGIEETTEQTTSAEEPAGPATTEVTSPQETAPETGAEADNRMEYEKLQAQYSELKEENLNLKQTIREKDLEIQELKRQIRLLEGSSEGQ